MRLEAFPNEIIAIICDQAEKEQLLNLRLANKHISFFATWKFARSYLHTVCALMTPHSLGLLGNICSNPAIGPHVKRIHISSGRVAPSILKKLARNVSIASRVTAMVPQQQVAVDIHRAATSKLNRMMERSTAEYRLANNPDEATALMVHVFGALKMFDRGITLCVYGDHAMHGRVLLGSKDVKLSEVDCDLCLKTTVEPCLKAIASTRYTLAGLSLDLASRFTDPSERFFLTGCDAIDLSRLTLLSLEVPSEYSRSVHDEL
ncbi:hypothetical protein E4T39_07638 [Aureobasidium subglaciale]|nr:hypothetical protein E4T39_07638 [Aureobasidium subglaciale]